MKEESVRLKPNALRSILALTKANVIETLRNPTSMFFNFFFPFIFIIIFGALDYSNMKYDLGVKSGSLKEGPVYEALQSVVSINLVANKTDEELDDALKKGTMAMVINIQNDEPMAAGPGVTVPRYKISIDKSTADPSGAATLNSIVENISNKINMSLLQPDTTLVTMDTTEVVGRKFNAIDFILPGQLAFALLMNALFGMSYPFVIMKKELILKRFFATPIKKGWIIAGQVISKMLLSIVQTVVIIGAGYYIFHFTLSNGIMTALSMLALSIIGIITFLAFGILVAAVSKNEDSVTPIAQLVMMPQLFLSGAFFQIEAFPAFLQPIAKVLPMTLLNDSFKMVAYEGAPLAQALPQIGLMLVWAIVLYIIAAKLFKWE